VQFAILQNRPPSATCRVHLVVSHKREMDSLTVGRRLQAAIELAFHGAEMERPIAAFRESDMAGAFEINELLVPVVHFHNPPSPDKRRGRILHARCHVSFRDLTNRIVSVVRVVHGGYDQLD